MENKNQNLEKLKYDPKKDLNKFQKVGNPIEPRPQGNPLNEANNGN